MLFRSYRHWPQNGSRGAEFWVDIFRMRNVTCYRLKHWTAWMPGVGTYYTGAASFIGGSILFHMLC